jgi:hypothetical protein
MIRLGPVEFLTSIYSLLLSRLSIDGFGVLKFKGPSWARQYIQHNQQRVMLSYQWSRVWSSWY